MNATPVTTPPDFRLSAIGQIAIRVRDIPRAVAFYRDQLGLPFLFEAPGLAFFQCEEIMLMLTLPETPEFDHPASILYFQVDDIDRAYQALGEKGVKFEDQPHLVHRGADYELWMSFFRDPDRNILAIRTIRKP